MTQGDRSGRDRRFANDPLRDSADDERRPHLSSGRRPLPPTDDEFEIPPWAGSSAGGQAGRRDAARGGAPPSRSGGEATPPRSSGSKREPLPQLGDAFKRRRSPDDEVDDRSSAAARDPYDRLRRVAAKPPRAVEFDEEDRDSGSYLGEVGEPFERLPPVPRDEIGRGRRRQTAAAGDRRQQSTPRVNRGEQLGNLLATASPQVRELAPLAGICVGSLVLMIVVSAVRVGSVAPWLPIHLNAEGTPDLWGSRSALWRIPLMAGMATVMAGALAWFMSSRDAFVARFAFLSALLIQALCWIGLIHLLW